MSKIDTELASSLKQAKSKALFFAFVAQGGDGKLLVSKARIPGKEIAEAKAEAGGGTVWQGSCQDEEGTLVFQVPKQPPGNLAGVVKKVIARDAGLSLTVEFRMGQGLEGDGERPRSPPTDAPASGMAAIKERIKVLKPRIDAHKESDPKTFAALSQRLVAALGSAQAKDFQTANSVLDEIDTGLKVGAPPAADEAPRFAARLKKLSPDVQKAQTGASPLAPEVKRQTAAIMALAGKKDFTQANAGLDQLEALVKQALAPSPGAPPTPPTDEAARFMARLKPLSPALQKAQTVATPQGQQVKAHTTKMMGFAQKKDFTQANARLDELVPLIKQALAGAAAAASGKASGAPTPTKTIGIWQQAKEEVDGQITKLASFFRATKEPDYLYLADHGLSGITKRLQVGLLTALMTYDGASGPDREKARVKAQSQVDEFKKFVLSDPAVALFDENPFGVSVTLRQTLGQALDALTRSLKA